jgi:uncharacterized membrane-anchored protein
MAINLKKSLVVVTIIAAIVTGILCFVFFRQGCKEWLLILGLVWAVGAPIWFWLEYYCIFRKSAAYEEKDASAETHFKYGQDLSKNVWLGMVVVIFAAISAVDENCVCDCKTCIKKNEHEVTTLKG